MTKIAGSGSADPDPDPHQNVMDPQHWFFMFFRLPAAGDEHGTDVDEGAGCAESGPTGEQQFLRREHQHRSRGLRVVRGAGGLLGRPLRTLREERGEFPARLLVAEYERRGAVVCRQFFFILK
jgi:hypothetical protein